MSEQHAQGADAVVDLNNELKTRREKLANLREQGIAFPNDFRRDHTSDQLHAEFDGKENEELEALNARNIEHNGKKYTAYEISQMQRARERNVRRWKKRYLAEDAAGLDTTDAAVRLKAARQSLAEIAQAAGGRVDSARVSVPKFGRSEASRANWAAKGYEKQQKDAIIIENLRTAAKLPKAAVIHLEPTKINVDALTFDDAHINAEREHRVSEEQAKQYIRNAKISVSVWNGQFERYYGTEGAAYVNTIKHEIRTAYSRAEFDENTTALIEEMKKNGILG